MGDYADAYMRKAESGPPGRTKAQNRATVQQLKLVRRRFCGFLSVLCQGLLGVGYFLPGCLCLCSALAFY